MSRTGLLITPTIEEVRLNAAKIGLPPVEADKFWYFYDSKGWKVGKTPMKSFMSALQGWKLRWVERERERKGFTGPSLMSRQVQTINSQLKDLE